MFGFIKKLFGEPTDFKKLVTDGAVILDVRTASEFKSGHIPGAINIPVDAIRGKLDELRKKNKTYITCCRSGARSGMAKNALQAAGLTAFNGGPWNSLISKIR
jgi:phage shock protein E